jgi:hypothetical protein
MSEGHSLSATDIALIDQAKRATPRKARKLWPVADIEKARAVDGKTCSRSVMKSG